MYLSIDNSVVSSHQVTILSELLWVMILYFFISDRNIVDLHVLLQWSNRYHQ